jgi:predicted 3-demethylubiquinone-9 3-methyltransferase (glyoxalase superfamily)
MAKQLPIISVGLWYDQDAEQAANFYKDIFPGSRIDHIFHYGNEGQEITGGKPGSVMFVTFTLAGLTFQAINGGPIFKINPSISLYVVTETEQETEKVWKKLSEGGTVLMELGKYDWSEKYGWVQDKYGLTWQIGLGKVSDVGQKITPYLYYVRKNAGRAEEAMKFYMSIFRSTTIDGVMKHPKGSSDPEGHIMHAQFKLADSKFMVSDSSADHNFNFNEAVSIIIDCKDQKEIDYYWDNLIAGGGKESMCGWLSDKFGVSWQVNALRLNEMLMDKDQKKVDRVTRAFLKMRKFNIAELEKAFGG